MDKKLLTFYKMLGIDSRLARFELSQAELSVSEGRTILLDLKDKISKQTYNLSDTNNDTTKQFDRQYYLQEIQSVIEGLNIAIDLLKNLQEIACIDDKQS